MFKAYRKRLLMAYGYGKKVNWLQRMICSYELTHRTKLEAKKYDTTISSNR